MKFVIALVSYLESLGYDTSSLRKSADGSKAIVHMQYAEILSKNLDTNANVTIYDRVNPDFQALLASDEWNGNVTGTPNSFGDLAELAKYEARLTAQVTEAKTDMDNFQTEIAGEVTTAKEELNAIVDNYQVTVNQQLEQNMSYGNQIDFVEMIRESNRTGQILTKIIGDRSMEIVVPFNNNRYARYTMKKDDNDDYIKLEDGDVGKLEVGGYYKNYSSSTGVFVTTAAPNYYTKEVGATVSLTFSGAEIQFVHYADDRGGIWEFAIDGNVVRTLSTHVDRMTALGIPFSTSGVKRYVQTIAKGLTDETHTLVATFKGDDPDYVPSTGVGTARGWIKYDSGGGTNINYTTFIVVTDGYNYVRDFVVYIADSNKEFAFYHKLKSGAVGSENWIPDHGIGTAFINSQKVLLDGKQITDWTPQTLFYPVDSVVFTQDMRTFHSSDRVNPTGKLLTNHFFTSRGVNIIGKFEAIKNIIVSKGYTFMFPISLLFANKLITSYRNKYQTGLYPTQLKTVLAEKFNAKSFAFINTTEAVKKDIVVAMTIRNVDDTLRNGKEGREENLGTWLEHRTSGMDKLYPQIFYNKEFAIGEKYTFSGSFHIGEVPMIDELI